MNIKKQIEDIYTIMQLRSGTVVTNNSSENSWVPSLDGNDYIPHTLTSGYPWEWAKTVHDALTYDGEWDEKYSYQLMDYLSRTSDTWMSAYWHEDASQDTKTFGDALWQVINHFDSTAQSLTSRVRTRSLTEYLEETHGYWQGIMRLAQEMRVEWNVAQQTTY